MMINRKCLALSTLLAGSVSLAAPAVADDAELVGDFCYALQAAMLCDNLQMRLDTEKKIERRIGAKVRGTGAPHNAACTAGLTRAFSIDKRELCTSVWQQYGCSGSKVPRLVQENGIRVANPTLCAY